jgi:hypothetical protein
VRENLHVAKGKKKETKGEGKRKKRENTNLRNPDFEWGVFFVGFFLRKGRKEREREIGKTCFSPCFFFFLFLGSTRPGEVCGGGNTRMSPVELASEKASCNYCDRRRATTPHKGGMAVTL